MRFSMLRNSLESRVGFLRPVPAHRLHFAEQRQCLPSAPSPGENCRISASLLHRTLRASGSHSSMHQHAARAALRFQVSQHQGNRLRMLFLEKLAQLLRVQLTATSPEIARPSDPAQSSALPAAAHPAWRSDPKASVSNRLAFSAPPRTRYCCGVQQHHRTRSSHLGQQSAPPEFHRIETRNLVGQPAAHPVSGQ